MFVWLVHLTCGAEFEWSGAITTTGTEPTARGYHTSVVYGDSMFVFGGYGGYGPCVPSLKSMLRVDQLSTYIRICEA